MNKETIKIKGTVQLIGELQCIPRNNIPDLEKILLTIETPDNQIFYPELRNHKTNMINKENITIGCAVEMEITFQGSEKNGKRYNNIYINSIKKI